MGGEIEAQEGEAGSGGLHSLLVVEPGRTTGSKVGAASLLHAVAYQQLPALLCPQRKVLREEGFSVKSVPEELNVSYGNNS